MSRALVVGLGNTLLGDDGVGVHVLRALRTEPAAEHLELLDGGTLGFRLAPWLAERRSCILIDAARMEQPPGTVRVLHGDALLAWAATGQRAGVHEAGLIDLISVLSLERRLPDRLALVAVEPAEVDWSNVLTPTVAAAVPLMCQRVMALCEDWSERGGVYG